MSKKSCQSQKRKYRVGIHGWLKFFKELDSVSHEELLSRQKVQNLKDQCTHDLNAQNETERTVETRGFEQGDLLLVHHSVAGRGLRRSVALRSGRGKPQPHRWGLA